MSRVRVSLRSPFLVATFTCAGVVACGLYGTEAPPPAADSVDQVVLHIDQVPTDVRCVRVTAVGPGRTVVRELEATGGVSMTENLTGLPLGTVTFTGEAFSAACASVTKTTIADWASAPVDASIVLGRLATVNLVMARNGRAKVGITFTDEAACAVTGATCRINSECCSKHCVAKVCAAAASAPAGRDAGAPASTDDPGSTDDGASTESVDP